MRSARDRRNTTLRIVDALKELPEQRKNLVIEDLLRVAGVSIPDALAKELILPWEEVVEMSEAGLAFGAHTLLHPILTNVPLEQAKLDIVQSKKDIETKIGRQVDFFSYPDGRLNSEIVKPIGRFIGGCERDTDTTSSCLLQCVPSERQRDALASEPRMCHDVHALECSDGFAVY